MFGKPIALNFNKKGKTHRTLTGASFSIMILIIVAVYFVSRIFILQQRLQVNVSSVSLSLDPNDLGRIYLNQTKMLFYVIIWTNLSSLNDIS